MTLLGSMARPVFRYAAIGLAVLGTGVAVLASAGALARPAVGAGAPAYQVIDLGVLPGDVWSFATSINDAGHVAGISTSNRRGAGFLLVAGHADDRPGCRRSAAGLPDFEPRDLGQRRGRRDARERIAHARVRLVESERRRDRSRNALR